MESCLSKTQFCTPDPVEMLKMKIDPAICMKTHAKGQNVHPQKGTLYTKMHQWSSN